MKPKQSMAAVCLSVLAAAAGTVGLPEKAHAAVYGGIFDPEDDQYRWFGSHVFAVEDACLATNGWKSVNDPYSCGSVSLTDGDLTVVNKPLAYTETTDFSGYSFIPNSASIFGIYVEGNELAGVDSSAIGPFVFSNTFALGGEWFLRWESGFAPVSNFGIAGGPPVKPGGAGDPVYLTNCNPDCVTIVGPATTVTFVRLGATGTVPEPSPLALLAAAGAAGVLLRAFRRRARTLSGR